MIVPLLFWCSIRCSQTLSQTDAVPHSNWCGMHADSFEAAFVCIHLEIGFAGIERQISIDCEYDVNNTCQLHRLVFFLVFCFCLNTIERDVAFVILWTNHSIWLANVKKSRIQTCVNGSARHMWCCENRTPRNKYPFVEGRTKQPNFVDKRKLGKKFTLRICQNSIIFYVEQIVMLKKKDK